MSTASIKSNANAIAPKRLESASPSEGLEMGEKPTCFGDALDGEN